MSFEFHAEATDKIDLEKCNFCNFGSSVALTLERVEEWVEVTLVRIYDRDLPTHKLDRNRKKTFCGRTERRTVY